MNRAERRRQGVRQPPPRMKHLTEDAFNNAINRAYQMGVNAGYEKASNYAVCYMLAVPLLVLDESMGEIWRKEYNGKSRTEHFFDLCTEKYEEYNEGQDTLERLMKDVCERTGLDILEKVMDNEQV